MASQRGRDLVLKITDGLSPATFTAITGIQNVSMVINNETVDITTFDEAPWRQLLADAGMRSMSFSGSGIFKDDAAINLIEDKVLAGSVDEYQFVMGNGDIFQGDMQVTSFSYAGDVTGAQTYDITVESAGTFVLTRA